MNISKPINVNSRQIFGAISANIKTRIYNIHIMRFNISQQKKQFAIYQFVVFVLWYTYNNAYFSNTAQFRTQHPYLVPQFSMRPLTR